MIPKVFHRVWLGGKPMPEDFVRWGQSWLDFHPGWMMKTWTEAEIQEFYNFKLLENCSSFAQQADIIRYEALFREGGVYVDTDMECVRNIESLLEGVQFFGCWQKSGTLSNAIFGGVDGHPALHELFEKSSTDFRSEPWNAMGPPFFTKIVLGCDSAKIFPRETFIPYTRAQYEALPDHPMKGLVPPDWSYAINHRSSIWHPDSTRPIGKAATLALEEARSIIEQVQYWHYRFRFPWGDTTPGKPGWAERVEKRRRHFFDPLLEIYGGSFAQKHVLDLGCCQGYWSFLSKNSGAESVFGIDASESFIREAKAVQEILGPGGCAFVKAHLEEDRWWDQVGEQRDITLLLGTLFHLTDPAYVLRRAMRLTRETIVIDGEVLIGDGPKINLIQRTPGEPTTVRSGMTSDIRAVATSEAIRLILKDGGFRTIRQLEPSDEMPADYKDGRTVSFIATRD